MLGADRNSTKLDWYFWSRGAMSRWTFVDQRVSVPVVKEKRRKGNGRNAHVLTSPFNLTFSSSVYGAYHLASRVFPCRFCTRMNERTMATTGSNGEVREEVNAYRGGPVSCLVGNGD